MNSKSHHTGKTRTGNIQVLVGGLVLFMSGTLLGGYVVWSHLKERPAVAPQVVGSEPVATIPQAHAFGTKSFVVSPQTPAVAPLPDGTKPQDSPPLAKPIGTKSLILVTPKDVASPSFTNQPGGTPKGSGNFSAPPAMSFGTKSAPVFAPSDLQKSKGPYEVVKPFLVPKPYVAPASSKPIQSPSGWRSPQVPTGNQPASQLPAPQSKPTQPTRFAPKRFTPKQAAPNPYQAPPVSK